jgi:hypothetical protein
MKKIKNYKVLEISMNKGYDENTRLWYDIELKDLETEESVYIRGYESGYTGTFYITDYDCSPDFLNTFEHVDELFIDETYKFIERI